MAALDNITRLSANVIRVLGQNPGKFTLQGTNTYLIGRAPPFLLLDTGAGLPAYLPLLRSALTSARPAATPPDTPDVSAVLLSHRHHDHVDGLPGVLGLLRDLWRERGVGAGDGDAPPYAPPRVCKAPLARGADAKLDGILDGLEEGTFAPAADGARTHALAEGQVLQGTGLALEVLHTPGHTPDSICLLLRAPAPEPEVALFTGDTVLGGSTAVFDDLAPYLISLRRLAALLESLAAPASPAAPTPAPSSAQTPIYPGHGPIVDDGLKLVRDYIAHRLAREQSVLALLATPPDPGAARAPGGEPGWTPLALVRKMYDGIPAELWHPAAQDALVTACAQVVRMHLVKLEREGRARFVGGERDGVAGVWDEADDGGW